jgi:hypothetical protein
MQIVGRRSEIVTQLATALEQHGIARPSPSAHTCTRPARPRRPGTRFRVLGAPPHARRSSFVPGGGMYLVNALNPDGTTDVAEMRRRVRDLRSRDPHVAIFVLLDERDPEAVRAARFAGATHYLGATAASNGEAAAWRVADVLEREASAGAAGVASAPRVELTAFVEPSPHEVEAARARAEAGLGSIISPAQAAAYSAALVKLDASDLREPLSGRLDARLIAERLGVSVSRLAPAAGVSQQALSARPDSLRAQAGLLHVARVLAALDEMLPRGQHAMWLRTPRTRFAGEAPLAMLLDGRAEPLARELEGALEGLPD